MDFYNAFWISVETINILLIIAVIFLERKNVTATWAWIMILSFIPIVGIVFYITLGQNLSRQKIFKWDKLVHKLVLDDIRKQKKQLEEDAGIFGCDVVKKYHELVKLNMNDNEAILHMNNQVKVFTDGQEKFDSVIEDIKNAKKHIHMLYYIVKSDDLGRRIVNALMEKAREGVEVRFIIDDSGSKKFSKKLTAEMRAVGIQVVRFFPGKLPMINLRLNYRNHRKLIIVDGEVGYIGGFNIGDEYLGLDKKFGYWRDTHLRIIGPSVNNIQSRFLLDWNQASNKKVDFSSYFHKSGVEDGTGAGVQIVSSGPDTASEQIKNAYIKMIMMAKDYIYIQSPYLIPDESVIDALKIAALSGVDVRLIIPNKPDHMFVYWATYANAGALVKSGVKVYTYEKGFMHAKTMVLDGEVSTVGTANLDNRSFKLNFEVNAVVYDKEVAIKLVEAFQADLNDSEQLTLEKYNNRSWIIYCKESISRLLSPVL